MARYHGEYSGWSDYVTVAERRRNAAVATEKLRKQGHRMAPVVIAGRVIAATFWGKAWCDNLASYRDYEYRLERGRSYVRNGLVVDLQIKPRTVTAMVSGSSLYRVTISIGEVKQAQWRSICKDCAGGIDSVVELLQGRFTQGVMERICRKEKGLFPRPADIRLPCSCPDFASMCKHVAAVLYGIGARLDTQPELLFRLRAVDENELVTHIDQSLPIVKARPAAGKVLEVDDLSAVFGLDMAGAEDQAEAIASPPATKRAKKAGVAKSTAKAEPAQVIQEGSPGDAPGSLPAKSSLSRNKHRTPARRRAA